MPSKSRRHVQRAHNHLMKRTLSIVQNNSRMREVRSEIDTVFRSHQVFVFTAIRSATQCECGLGCGLEVVCTSEFGEKS